MKKFILKTSLFLLLLSIVCILMILSYIKYNKIDTNYIPAPNLSDSYSFNEKMMFLQKKNINVDILAIGSSMTLNNLNSNEIVKKINSNSYLNAASWGMTMKDDFLVLKIICDIHTPKILIISSGICDFQDKDKEVNYPVSIDYLKSDNSFSNLLMDIKTFNVQYYMKNFSYAKKVRTANKSYEYLNYDNFGGVSLGKDLIIDKKRWNKRHLNNITIDVQYDYLDSISNFCKKNKIKLLFFQSPFRNGLYSTFNNSEKTKMKQHLNKIKKISYKNKFTLVNSVDLFWADSLFVDSSHLNKNGAVLYTKYCLDNVNGISEILKK